MKKKPFFYTYTCEAIGNVQQRLEQVLLYYHGPFNHKIILNLAQTSKKHFENDSELNWKVFSIMVELLQNIYFNTIEHNVALKNEPVGIVFIEETESRLQITAANVASQESWQNVQEKCEYINRLTISELHSYKKELLKKSENDSHYRGGNIGLVQIALLSQNKLDYQVSFEDYEFPFFMLTTTLNKQ